MPHIIGRYFPWHTVVTIYAIVYLVYCINRYVVFRTYYTNRLYVVSMVVGYQYMFDAVKAKPVIVKMFFQSA